MAITLIGDAAYPLLPWLMKGFQYDGNLTRGQIQFNKRLSSARMVVEGAFGRLKCRFRCLLKKNDTSLEKLPFTIAAWCTLHNICEMNGEKFNPEWLQNDVNIDVNVNNDVHTPDATAINIRRALTNFVSVQNA